MLCGCIRLFTYHSDPVVVDVALVDTATGAPLAGCEVRAMVKRFEGDLTPTSTSSLGLTDPSGRLQWEGTLKNEQLHRPSERQRTATPELVITFWCDDVPCEQIEIALDPEERNAEGQWEVTVSTGCTQLTEDP